MKIKKSKHKKVKCILDNKLRDFYISHEEEFDPSGDFGEKVIYFAGWLEPIKPMSLKNTTKLLVPKTCVLYE